MKKDNFSAMVEEYLAELGPRGRAMALAGLLGVSSLGLMGCPNPTTIEIQSVTIASMPTKTTYYTTDTAIDLSGLKLQVTNSDSSTETIDYDSYKDSITYSGFTAGASGTQTIYVEYGGQTASFEITVEVEKVDITIECEKNFILTINDTRKEESTSCSFSDISATGNSVQIVQSYYVFKASGITFENGTYTLKFTEKTNVADSYCTLTNTDNTITIPCIKYNGDDDKD